ncbi:MAG: S26 family signal peptidase [Planctomycetia bacterium]|nr:S26 family signal peptidase [Planctomycetia bacterium]
MRPGFALLWLLFPLALGCEKESAIPIRGTSMLQAFYGGTRLERCPTCLFEGPVPDDGLRMCVNCGWIFERAASDDPNSGGKIRTDFVILDRHAEPKVGDVVAARFPGTRDFVVKRVAATPGDVLEYRKGKYFLNGRRVVRPLKTLEEQLILTHDDRFRPFGVSRWASSGAAGALRPTLGGWEISLDPDESASLVYHHAQGRRLPDGQGGLKTTFAPSPVVNHRFENGTQMRADWTHAADEFFLSFHVEHLEGSGAVLVLIPAGNEIGAFCFLLDNRKSPNGGNLRSFPLKNMDKNGKFRVAEYCLGTKLPIVSEGVKISTMDGVLRVWRGDKLLEEAPLRVDGELAPLETQAELSETEEEKLTKMRDATNVAEIHFLGEIRGRISALALWRGEYYGNFLANSNYFSHFDEKVLAFLPTSGYYLIGDNFLLSDDSRRRGAVPKENILGVVRKVHVKHESSLPLERRNRPSYLRYVHE